MGSYECIYCHSIRNREDVHAIDATHKKLLVTYHCGSQLEISFPEGTHKWFKACQGISSQKLDNYSKLPDN